MRQPWGEWAVVSNSHMTMTLAQAVREGRRFWGSEGGVALWQAQRACLGPLCESRFGSHSLQLGMASRLTDMCPIRHAMSWAPTRALAQDDATLVCDPSTLPLPDESLDLVLVHHLLEVMPNAHHLVREAARVTRDDGLLVMMGWNPFGADALGHLSPASRRRWPCKGRWRRSGRLREWLAFVDFEIDRVDYCGFRLPGGHIHNLGLETLGRRYNLPFGGCYLIVARRKQIPVQPVRTLLRRDSMAGNWLGPAALHRDHGGRSGRATHAHDDRMAEVD